jgi:hypothetical protein
MQALMMFFIDGASFIDEDDNWQYFLLYEIDEKVR